MSRPGLFYCRTQLEEKIKCLSQKIIDHILDGNFNNLPENALTAKEAEQYFKAVVKEAIKKLRHYNFVTEDLCYSQAVRSCASFVLSNKISFKGIDTLNVKNIKGSFSVFLFIIFVKSFLHVAETAEPSQSSSSSSSSSSIVQLPPKSTKRIRNDAQGSSSTLFF